MKKILYVAALLALLAVPFIAVSAQNGPPDICHATGAENKWVVNSPANFGDIRGHVGAGHQAGRDIIPPFNYPGGSFPGQNWDADGQAIYRNGCEIPPPPPELFVGCAGWRVFVGDDRVDIGFWTLPFELESAESRYWEGTINEPEKCLETPDEPILRIAGTCSDEGVGQIIGALNLGDLGVALLIEGQGSQHVINENGEFGPIPARAGDYTWTIFGLGDNGRYVISNGEFTVNACYQTCDETFREAQEPTYSDWNEWEWDSDRGLFVQTRIKSTVVLAIDARDKETVCARGVIEEEEERTRGPDEALVGASLGCDGRAGKGTVYQLIFSVTVEPAGGATVFFNGNEYTESTGGHVGFGSYDWNAEAAESFKIVGDDEGTVKLTNDDCNPIEPPPEHPPTGADPNVALAVVTGLTGFALAGIGGSILYVRRRASR